MGFQTTKRKHRQCEAFLSGHIAPAYADGDLQEVAAEQAAHQAALAQKAARELANKRARLKAPDDLNFIALKTCYVIRGLRAAVSDKLQAFGIQQRPSPLGATLLVVPDVAALTPDLEACLYLQGGVATVPGVVNGEQRGPTRAYLPAVAVRRELWLSDAWCHGFSELATIVRHIGNLDGSTWSFIGSAEEFEKVKGDANKKGRNAGVIAVMTQKESDAIAKHKPAWVSRHAFTWKRFLEFIGRVDMANWRSGLPTAGM